MEPTNTNASPQSAPAVPAGAKILLVEDDDTLANTYALRLQVEGFVVQRAADGEAALVAAKANKPDLVILDVMMPKVGGFDTLDIMRNTPDLANIKVLMLTALSQPEDQQRAEQLGANGYLVKSQASMADVIDHIKQILAS